MVATNAPVTGFTNITRKYKDHKAKLLTRKFTAHEQKVDVLLEAKTNITTTRCLTIANEVLRQQTSALTVNLTHVYLTERDNLVFDTSLATRGTDYELYFPAVQQAFGQHMTTTHIRWETHWSKFLLHHITLDTTMDDIITFLQANYLQLKLVQTPRWLITDKAKRTTKEE